MTASAASEDIQLLADRKHLQKLIEAHKRIVFFGGAGVSTESGIPDFRGAEGLYTHTCEELISHHYFMEHPKEFFAFYRDKMVFPQAKPNCAHYKIAQLEEEGIVSAVVTQNIDGLHQKAGSKNVLELHGSVKRNTCMSCGRHYGLDAILTSADVPRCSCGGIIKPDVVLYEEPLDDNVVTQALNKIAAADMLIVAGTSLVVYPAAGFVRAFNGDTLVLINMSATPLDTQADFVSHQPVGRLMDW